MKTMLFFSIFSLVVIATTIATTHSVYADPIGKPCTLPSGKQGTTNGSGDCVATDGSGERGPAGNNTQQLTPSAGNQVVRVPDAVSQSSVGTVSELIGKVIAFLGWGIGVLSLIGLLVGSFMYVVSAGDPNRTRVAKDAIVYSVVGLVIAMLAYSIVTFVIGRVN